MSSRNAVSNSGDSRYLSRDRSPPRFPERRPSAAYGSTPLATRITDPGHRTNDSHSYSSVSREPREPPRAPKALIDGSRSGRYGSRGRSFGNRGEPRDSDFRDMVDSSSSRRGIDRDWSRIDNRERRISPAGRNRSRSPIPRDFRDSRDFGPREADTTRVRRESRDGPPSATSSISDALPSANFSSIGTLRGRGRGNWEYSRGGRGNYSEDRDVFRNRSRSRDRIWEKKGRDEKDLRDQDVSRRDDDNRKEWDERERDADKHRREAGSIRPDSRNSTTAQATPSAPISASAISLHQHNTDRLIQSTRAGSVDSSHRPSGSNATSTLAGSLRDSERNDLLLSRAERDRQSSRINSPPPQAPQVPAFGSIVCRTTPTSQSGGNSKDRSKDSIHTILTPRPTSLDTSKEAPLAVKIKTPGSASNNPKSAQSFDRPPIENLGASTRTLDNDRDRQRPSSQFNTNANIPSSTEYRREHSQNASSTPLQSNGPPEQPAKGSQVSSKHKSPQSFHPSHKKDLDDPNHHTNVAISPHSVPPNKMTSHESASQSSPIKIPTGPRAERSVSTTRQPGSPPIRGAPARPSIVQRQPRPGSLKWVRQGLPQHTPRGPSIMNTVPTKRDYVGEEKRFPHAERDPLKPVEIPWSRVDSNDKDEAFVQGHGRRVQAERTESKPDLEIDAAERAPKVVGDDHGRQSPRINILDTRKSVDPNDLDVEDGLMDLDDEEFAEDERKFDSTLQALDSKRPLTPRRHPTLLALLDECDALASAAEDLSKGKLEESSVSDKRIDSIPLGLPSPKLEDEDKKSLEDTRMITASPVVIRRKTPPIESLPFLLSGPPTPFSNFEEIKDIPTNFELMQARVIEILGNQRERVESENEEMRVEFSKKYKEWRMSVEDYEEMKKAENPVTPVPESPIPANLPLTASTPTLEGRRSAKNTSEFDFERVLRESAVTAQEDQERRNREARTFINLEKEAEIPQMRTFFDIEASTFHNKNCLVETQLVLDAFAFFPQEDDFTAEEQEIFLDNYLAAPKKWGIIAAALEGRDYQDCVRHYYHTKAQAQYKEKEKVFSRLKKGRKGHRGLQGRPKSNVLMPLYDGTMEFDAPNIPVTDTGRPKRNAAPTFGITADGENITPASTPARRGNSGVKSEANGETPAEKPSGKRGRTASVKEKPSRKGKALLLAAGPAPSPQKNEKEITRAKSKEPKIESDQRPEEMEGAQLLAGLHSSRISQPLNQSIASDGWLGMQPPLANIPSQTPKSHQQQQQQQQVNQELPQQQQATRVPSGTPTSYWSVPDQTDFQKLLSHFGTDWHAIAAHLKTKTPTMIRNHYFRLVESGKPGIKQAATQADLRIKQGEDMGPPPQPTNVPKRRYDNTQTAPPRQLAPSTETIEIEDGSPRNHSSKGLQPSPPQPSQVPARFPAIAQAETSSASPTSQSASTISAGSVLRTQSQPQSQGQPQMQRSSINVQGPQAGFFSSRDGQRPLQAQPPLQIQQAITRPTSHPVIPQQKRPEVLQQRQQETQQQKSQEVQQQPQRQHQTQQRQPEVRQHEIQQQETQQQETQQQETPKRPQHIAHQQRQQEVITQEIQKQRQSETQHERVSLDRQRIQDLETFNHDKIRQQDVQQTSPKYQPLARSHKSAVSHPTFSSNSSITSTPVRIAPSRHISIDERPGPTSHQQQHHTPHHHHHQHQHHHHHQQQQQQHHHHQHHHHHHHQQQQQQQQQQQLQLQQQQKQQQQQQQPQQSEQQQQRPSSPLTSRPLDSLSHSRYQSIALQSPATTKVPIAISPPTETVRPSSVPAVTIAQPPARPPQVTARRSNIMSILNDEPTEPQGRKRLSDSNTGAPSLISQSPANPTQLYQQTQPAIQLVQKRDPASEILHQLPHQHQRPSSQLSQPQQISSQSREPANWTTAIQRPFSEIRSNYQPPQTNSPQLQPSYPQASSRPPLQQLQRAYAPSPPPAHFAHSRASSYTSTQSHQHQPQQQQQQQQQQVQSHNHHHQAHAPSTPANIPLQASPYRQMQPLQHTTPPQHLHIQQQQQQHEAHANQMRLHEQRRLAEQQQQQQQQKQQQQQQQQQRHHHQNHLPESESGMFHQPYIRQQQQQQQDAHRQSDILRQRDMRQHHGTLPQDQVARRQKEQAFLQQQQQEQAYRQQDLAMRETVSRTFTPPNSNYMPQGYGPPPQPGLHPQGQARGYEGAR